MCSVLIPEECGALLLFSLLVALMIFFWCDCLGELSGMLDNVVDEL